MKIQIMLVSGLFLFGFLECHAGEAQIIVIPCAEFKNNIGYLPIVRTDELTKTRHLLLDMKRDAHFVAEVKQEPKPHVEWKLSEPVCTWYTTAPVKDSKLTEARYIRKKTKEKLSAFAYVIPNNTSTRGEEWCVTASVRWDWTPEGKKLETKPKPVIATGSASIAIPEIKLITPQESDGACDPIKKGLDGANQCEYVNNELKIDALFQFRPNYIEFKSLAATHILLDTQTVCKSLELTGYDTTSTGMKLYLRGGELPNYYSFFDWSILVFQYGASYDLKSGYYSFFEPDKISPYGSEVPLYGKCDPDIPNWFYYWRQIDDDQDIVYKYAPEVQHDYADVNGQYYAGDTVIHLFKDIGNNIAASCKDKDVKAIDKFFLVRDHERYHRMLYSMTNPEAYVKEFMFLLGPAINRMKPDSEFQPFDFYEDFGAPKDPLELGQFLDQRHQNDDWYDYVMSVCGYSLGDLFPDASGQFLDQIADFTKKIPWFTTYNNQRAQTDEDEDCVADYYEMDYNGTGFDKYSIENLKDQSPELYKITCQNLLNFIIHDSTTDDNEIITRYNSDSDFKCGQYRNVDWSYNGQQWKAGPNYIPDESEMRRMKLLKRATESKTEQKSGKPVKKPLMILNPSTVQDILNSPPNSKNTVIPLPHKKK